MSLKLTGIVLGFEVTDELSLAPLVKEFGFSKPEKKDNGSVTSSRRQDFGDGTYADYTLTRKDNKFLFSVKASYPLDGEHLDFFTAEMLEELQSVGL